MPRKVGGRIGLCIDGPELGGAELAVQNLVLASDDEWEFVLLAAPTLAAATIRARTGIEHAILPPPEQHRRHPLQVRRAIAAAHVDLVQVTLCNPTAATVPLVASLSLGLPTIAVEQLVRPTKGTRRVLKAAIARRLAAHVAVGQASARETEHLSWLREGSVTAIYNGIDIGPWSGRTTPSMATRLVTVGRLEGQKGLDYLLRALAEVPAASLTIVGDGSQRANLAALADQLAISSRVTFVGWSDDPSQFLRNADIFVLASRNEAFPLSIVEAMLHELPVVATDVGSVRESVRPGHTGVLVPSGDPAALATALNDLMASPDECARLGSNARAVALAEFSSSKTATEFAEIWRTILANRATRARETQGR